MKSKSNEQSTQKMKALYRDKLHTPMGASTDERIHDSVKHRLFERKKRNSWWQVAIPSTALCLLLLVTLNYNSQIPQEESTTVQSMLTEVDQMSDVSSEVDEALFSTQILAYEDYDSMIEPDYEF